MKLWALTKRSIKCFICFSPLFFLSNFVFDKRSLLSPSFDLPQSVKPFIIPNLLLAGAQKSGTTALFAALELVSQNSRSICLPKKLPEEENYYRKELHFFDTDERFREGPAFFHERFRHCLAHQSHKEKSRKQWRLDATPAYMLFPEKIVSFYEKYAGLDGTRIIFCLREPVSREISWYKHQKRDYLRQGIPLAKGNLASLRVFWEHRNFSELLANNGDNARNLASPLSHNKGLYGPLLRRWIESMPGRRSQILVLSYAELLSDPVSVLRRIRGFLGLPHQVHVNASHGLVHEVPIRNRFSALLYNSSETPCSYQDQLSSLFEKSNQQLYQLLQNNPGPSTEERPFRSFRYRCDH